MSTVIFHHFVAGAARAARPGRPGQAREHFEGVGMPVRPCGLPWEVLGCLWHLFEVLLAIFWVPCVNLDVTWDYLSTQVGTLGLLFEA